MSPSSGKSCRVTAHATPRRMLTLNEPASPPDSVTVPKRRNRAGSKSPSGTMPLAAAASHARLKLVRGLAASVLAGVRDAG